MRSGVLCAILVVKCGAEYIPGFTGSATNGTGSGNLTTHTTASCIPQDGSNIPRRTTFVTKVIGPDETLIPTNETFISSKDFIKTATKRDPTYRITRPGTYVLQEDIVLDYGEPDSLGHPFHFGFVMGISISGDNVRLDLNGKTIRMSDRFFKHARFFNIIELAQVPYPRDAGFMEDIIPARNVIIENGTIGQTSHGSIHGNDNERILIRDVTIKEFEVAAIAINNVRNLVIDRVFIDNGGALVPVHSTFSVMWMLNRTLTDISRDTQKSDATRSQANAYLADPELLDILQFPGSDKHRVTENASGKPEGSMFGIYLSSKFNVGTLEHGVLSKYSQNVVIQNVRIRNIASGPSEKVGIRVDGKPVVDSAGNNLCWDFLYDATGARLPLHDNALNRLKYKLARMLVWSTRVHDPSLISQQFVDSIMNETKLLTAHEANIYPMGGLDARDGHTPKGTFGIRLDGVGNVRIDNCTIDNVSNSDGRGANPRENTAVYSPVPVVWNGKTGSKKVYKGNYAFGMSFGSSTNVDVAQSAVRNVRSENGNAFGMAFMGPTRAISVSQMTISDTTVNSATYEEAPARLPDLNSKAMLWYEDEDASDILFRNVTTQAIHSSPIHACTGSATDSELCPGAEGWSTEEPRCEKSIEKDSKGIPEAGSA
eukprot:GEMP01023778.1.p1 GENE.GEMP01023778.1~~GEMP01023778.1.p1  ORF type:complete len:656 (+),score=143.07 GEMP01023778.1:125-2092(+)